MGLRSAGRLRGGNRHPFLPVEGPLVAALDACTEAVGVALARDGIPLLVRRTVHPSPRGMTLTRALSEALEELGAEHRDLAAVIASLGPGSFTGVRLTLMAAKALAWSLGIPLVGVDIPEVLAQAVGPGPVAVAVDARQGQVYLALRDTAETGPVAVTTPDEAAAAITAFLAVNPAAALTGTGFPAYEPLRALRPGMVRGTDFPDPGVLLDLGLVRLAAGRTLDPLTAEPLYVQAFRTTPSPQAG
jgi:tRNA threonylcarbamoyladenosine biosynthesis protein TsaB